MPPYPGPNIVALPTFSIDSSGLVSLGVPDKDDPIIKLVKTLLNGFAPRTCRILGSALSTLPRERCMFLTAPVTLALFY